MSKEELVIYGAGGAGRDLAFGLSIGTQWSVKGYVDDAKGLEGKAVNSLPVLGGFDWLRTYEGNLAVSMVSSATVRRNIVARIQSISKSISFPIVLNEHSFMSDLISWGEGCVVAVPLSTIATNVSIGRFVWIHGNTGIGHDVSIGAFSILYTRISIGGEVQIGENCVIGSASVIKPRIQIGDNVIVGAGAVVVKDVPSNVVIAGNPARVVKTNPVLPTHSLPLTAGSQIPLPEPNSDLPGTMPGGESIFQEGLDGH